MKAGRDLDLLVSEKVLGCSVVRQKSGAYMEANERGTRPLPAYSKDIAAAWEIVDRLAITLLPIVGGQWFALVGKGSGWESPAELFQFLGAGEFVNAGAAVAETPALAICLAGYTAVEKRRAADAPAEPTGPLQ